MASRPHRTGMELKQKPPCGSGYLQAPLPAWGATIAAPTWIFFQQLWLLCVQSYDQRQTCTPHCQGRRSQEQHGFTPSSPRGPAPTMAPSCHCSACFTPSGPHKWPALWTSGSSIRHKDSSLETLSNQLLQLWKVKLYIHTCIVRACGECPYLSVYVCVHMYIHTHVHILIYICLYVHWCVCTSICVYIYLQVVLLLCLSPDWCILGGLLPG